jgi:hypothetical protein
MMFRLSDMMDLDYLLALDDDPKAGGSPELRAARDRDIFRQAGGAEISDKSLMAAWLSYRKMLYLDQAGPHGYQRLPGRLFNSLFTWTARGMSLAGALTGLILAYGFLAYHGTRPVNVALFFFVFVLMPAIFFLFSAAGLLMHHAGRSGTGPGGMTGLASRVLFVLVPEMLSRIRMKKRQGSTQNGPTRMDEALLFLRTKKQAYGDLFFWPLVIPVSVFALFFSLGALSGTLFRVAFSDVAFGWQSTLAATPAAVHDLVTLVSLPWAAWIPDVLAGPTPEQIQGSRIILKQGIASLATEHLVSWWPFLCLSMVCYAVIPRLVIIFWAVMAQRSALNRFDFQQPRFRRLIVRMKSPVMDIGFEEKTSPRQASDPLSETGHPPYNPDESPETPVAEQDPFSAQTDRQPQPVRQKMNPDTSETVSASVGTPAVVLAPAPAWGQAATHRVCDLLSRQFLLDVRQVIFVEQDLATDSPLLGPDVLNGADPVIFLQEVWQPPIRGILHYLVQLKQGVLRDKNLWVLLTRAPEEENLGVADRDVNAEVWQDRILKLGHPDMLVERIRP